MPKNLMIVESPTKSKTIKQYLGKDFEILASMGHIRDLPQKEFGINIENNFKPYYVLNPDKKKIVNQIIKRAKESEKVFLASDNDREGEAIAWHLKEILKKSVPKQPIFRVVFNEITREAIQESIKSPAQVDENKVNAQQTRRILDRIVGYKVSPVLWKVIAKNLSAGRVQTVALRLLCEREEEIQKFVPQEYWIINAELKPVPLVPIYRDHLMGKDTKFKAILKKYKEKLIKLTNESEADAIFNKLEKEKYIVADIKQESKIISPFPAYITSTLQQEASKILGFSTKKTMRIAQQLYEGVNVKDKNIGLISYMRTDSVRVSDRANAELKKLIKERFPEKYSNPFKRIYKNKNKAQDAHEAIRPTSSFRTPESIKDFLSQDQYKLYKLIWQRFVATQMACAKVNMTQVLIKAGDGLFESNGSTIEFDGFMKCYPYITIKYIADKMPLLNVMDELELIKLNKNQNFTKPPARYTEAALVKKLESEGIGRPSTYSPIISTLLARKYVNLVKKKFYPTELGMEVEKFLIKKFSDFFNVSFTREMENRLDEIENGTTNWLQILENYYEEFIKILKNIDIKAERANLAKVSDIKCEKCGAQMIIKWGRNGQFLACSNFPKCKNTKNFKLNENGKVEIIEIEEEKTDEICPKCGGKLVLKIGKFGKFYACSNYPKCKFTKAFSTGLKCPLCDGELLERKSKKSRKTFYGCSNYPKCKFITNYKPINLKCPDCGVDTMFEKSISKNGIKKIICLNCKKELIT
ncbi:MAG: type I DNA topoisomerase [Candidatus Cloacimonetes bacterium]|nr:type I DNA topoisomerase [Candidatus Cloacimonadota bacterium]